MVATSTVKLQPHVKEETYKRILCLRKKGYSIPDLVLLGIQAAEKKEKITNDSK